MEGGLINPLALIRTGAAKGVTSPGSIAAAEQRRTQLRRTLQPTRLSSLPPDDQLELGFPLRVRPAPGASPWVTDQPTDHQHRGGGDPAAAHPDSDSPPAGMGRSQQLAQQGG